ncbi:hypothetical protein A3K48_05745 [candidate division WOR-1 bacterium RIFOXYA12_FULL_52_29]|uniref:Cell surface protein SprA n=1 Tax=candidate division WOR-1 bacterium RIFOXYC12_FULL_54_18 TaxID=1802584 RepID=A0A1F4T6W3_UNCSA|nr:MAG: hypothetical protein A3K44_05745 [candidate division WOR-1 bacterium RIFOXYA2_FULL_51_19]OGC18037.1 MAG: hypothetical protein A3K48_05745 [candidate division WOR-1 bacterium RIFOXYA12_FULL_52_29]OGC26893.1 MAG: hypothetical protein A3K32_05740 [candidate division WOR-1 bacterium RIFOXYB2_FULL_45_9]OGC28454.1 MAG: hypothetical protein A3K49_05745 [candidate division WOR-1 bacterium RIFOXYC12_FULL_54_18]OGC31091.1 MAG: hypothetical protein A2346_06875 [candidate division WOR-1 bacterium R
MLTVKATTRALFVLSAALWFTVAPAMAQSETYPQIDISGYKKYETKNVSVSPDKQYFNALSQLGGFYPTYSGGPWQERLQLRILGQLSKDLSVSYDLEQQPESPERFDVKVKYYNTELSFGDINATFSGNEFVSASKTLNGVMLTSKDSWYDVTVVPSAKLKSQTQALTSQKGNNTPGPYNLGHGGIVEGSEVVLLNNNVMVRNADYTIDYFEGKITFTRQLSQTDEFKYSYEYTNIIDLFFPSLSRRDFFGWQSRFTVDPEKIGKPEPKPEPLVTSVRETFPTIGSSDAFIQENEAFGQYRLKNSPLIKFSETLTFMGTKLKKNEDYIIRYDSGEIKLLTRFLPSTEEALSVEYRFHQTSSESESIPGMGSRGPYNTRYSEIVPESERVMVDGKLFVRDLDYTINYKTGQLLFGVVIGPTSTIFISYKHNIVAILQEAPSKFPKEMKVGVTYLKESAKKGGGAPTSTAIDQFSGQDIINKGNVAYLTNRPVPPTTEATITVRVLRGGVSALMSWEADYIIPTTSVDPATGYAITTPNVKLAYINDRTDLTDGYGTGTIAFINNSILPSDEVTVAYTYKKGIVGKYSGVGNGSQGPYYLRNVKDIVPGSETIQVWEQGSSVITTYVRNSSFEANAGDSGYFFNYNKDNSSITFNNFLSPTTNFQMIYQYVPPSTDTNEDISMSAIGVDGSFKIGDVFNIDSSWAKSESDQVMIGDTSLESFRGNGTKNYVITSPGDIIDGSDRVYVNNLLLNKEADYFISNPDKRTINLSFYYITPSSADAIVVEYMYQDPAGATSVTGVKSDTAFRLGAGVSLFDNKLALSGSTRKVGFDFSPLGSAASGAGSESEEYNLSLAPGFHSLSTSYAYKYNQSPIGTTHDKFSRSWDHSISTSVNPNGLAAIGFSYRKFTSLDDPATPTSLHNSDNDQDSYSASVTPLPFSRGELSIATKGDVSFSQSKTDVVDKTNLTTSLSRAFHYNVSGSLTKNASFSLDHQESEPTTKNSIEAETARTNIQDNSYSLSLNLVGLSLGRFQSWTAQASRQEHFERKYLPTPEARSDTLNETYHMDLQPISWLSGSLDHNRQERVSYVLNQENPRTERSAISGKYLPFGWLTFGGSYSRSEAIPETGSAFKTSGRTKAGDASWSVFSFRAISLSSRFALSDAIQRAPSGNTQISTFTKSLSQGYTMSLTPIPVLPISIGYSREDYKNNNDAVTSPVTTETRNDTISASLTFNAIPKLSVSADYNLKKTYDLIARNTLDKTVINSKANYQLFSWGSLVYELSDESNGGEVQSGVLQTLNIKKRTQSLGLNINIPVDNPVMSNISLLASLKNVEYHNLSNSNDDFTASLFSFEGTLNF